MLRVKPAPPSNFCTRILTIYPQANNKKIVVNKYIVTFISRFAFKGVMDL